MDRKHQAGMATILAGIFGSGVDFLEIGEGRTTSFKPIDRIQQVLQDPAGHDEGVIDYGGANEVKIMFHDVSTAKLAAVVDYMEDNDGSLDMNDEAKVLTHPGLIIVPNTAIGEADTNKDVIWIPRIRTTDLAALVHAVAATDSPVEWTGRSLKTLADAADAAVPAGSRFGRRGLPPVAAWAGQLPAGFAPAA